MSILARFFRSSPARCVDVPLPAWPKDRLPGFALRRRDHVGQRLERGIGAHQQDVGRGRQQRDRREILERVVGNFRIQKRIGGMPARHHDQRVAIGRRRRQRLRGDHAARARPVFDDDATGPIAARPHRPACARGCRRRRRPHRARKYARAWTGNGDCAERAAAARPASPAAAAAIRNHLPMASLPNFSLRCFAYRTSRMPLAAPRAQITATDRDMLTIPPIASSFGASTATAATVANERSSAKQGRMRWRLPTDKQPHDRPRARRPGTRSCCKRSSATTSGWCPMFPTAC